MITRDITTNNLTPVMKPIKKPEVKAAEKHANKPQLQLVDQFQSQHREGEKAGGRANQIILAPLMRHDKDPEYQPIIRAVEQGMARHESLQKLQAIALQTAQNQRALRPANKPQSKEEAIARSFTSLAIAFGKPYGYSAPGFFQGEADKTMHFATSAAMTARLYVSLGALPPDVREATAGKGVFALGWMKEFVSIPFSGFGADDVVANKLGIDAAMRAMRSTP